MQDGTVAQSCEGTVFALGSALMAVRGCRSTHNDVATFVVWQDAQITVAHSFSGALGAGRTGWMWAGQAVLVPSGYQLATRQISTSRTTIVIA